MNKPAIFLDRDGVIIENRANYVLSWEDVEIFDEAIEALVRYAGSDYLFVIVTNQSPIGRGLLDLSVAQSINEQLVNIIERRGGRIDRWTLCPHAPSDQCHCRKPEPGMLIEVANELNIDLSKSIMIGDALTDLKAGMNAGVREVILLKTGRGLEQSKLPAAIEYPNAQHFDNLGQALDWFFQSD